MDWFYFIIFIGALAVYFLDKMHKEKENKEHFSDNEIPPKRLGVNYNAPNPDPSASQGVTNIKFPGIPKSTSRFTKFGPVPPQPRCNITTMDGNCSNYDYDDNTGTYQQLCQKTYNVYPNIYPSGHNEFNVPLYVMGKSLSRVNQCNNLYNPKP